MLVDDEQSIVKMGEKALSRLGYRVTSRTDSRGALALFTANPDDYDLVITDMTMPGVTGEKLALEIHRMRPRLPVIICTGYSSRINGEMAAKAGIAAVFHKPIIKSELARVVRDTLDAV